MEAIAIGSDHKAVRDAIIIQHAANRGTLHQVPKEAFTTKALTLKSKTGHTLLHAAAWRGWLNQIPTNVLTAETLLVADDNGFTPLHAAAF